MISQDARRSQHLAQSPVSWIWLGVAYADPATFSELAGGPEQPATRVLRIPPYCAVVLHPRAESTHTHPRTTVKYQEEKEVFVGIKEYPCLCLSTYLTTCEAPLLTSLGFYNHLLRSWVGYKLHAHFTEEKTVIRGT